MTHTNDSEAFRQFIKQTAERMDIPYQMSTPVDNEGLVFHSMKFSRDHTEVSLELNVNAHIPINVGASRWHSTAGNITLQIVHLNSGNTLLFDRRHKNITPAIIQEYMGAFLYMFDHCDVVEKHDMIELRYQSSSFGDMTDEILTDLTQEA